MLHQRRKILRQATVVGFVAALALVFSTASPRAQAAAPVSERHAAAVLGPLIERPTVEANRLVTTLDSRAERWWSDDRTTRFIGPYDSVRGYEVALGHAFCGAANLFFGVYGYFEHPGVAITESLAKHHLPSTLGPALQIVSLLGSVWTLAQDTASPLAWARSASGLLCYLEGGP